MPRRTVPLVSGEHYHVYNRGHSGQKIFLKGENYLFFPRRVREYLVGENQTPQACEALKASGVHTRLPKLQKTSEVGSGLEVGCAVVAYCLMPNHFHLLVRPRDDRFSRGMQRFSISYAKAMNKRMGRSGALFQGAFEAVRVDRDEYSLHLSRYIHLNPVEAGLVRRPEDWEFSSYRDYVGLRQGTLPVPGIILSQFSSPGAYREFVEADGLGDVEIIEHLLLD